MWPLDIIKNYIIAILAVMVLILSFAVKYTYGLYQDKIIQISGYNAIIEATNKEQLGKQELAKEQIEVIKWKTKEKIKTVKEFIVDENKSDCANALDLARLVF